MAISALPITVASTTYDVAEIGKRIIEDASQTLLRGTPVMINTANGALKAWDGASLANAIVGIAQEDAHNFATAGPDAPTPFVPYLGPGSSLKVGNVPNEPSGINIPRGAPFIDGRLGVVPGLQSYTFRGLSGNAGALTTPTAADIGNNYGLTIDSNNQYWYVDFSKTGASAAVKMVALDPADGSISGARILFQFLPAVVNQL